MDRGKATQVMVYPRMKTKDVIVKFANSKGQRMSNFFITAALEKIARETNVAVEDMIPKNEFEELQRARGRSAIDYNSAKPKTRAGKA
jgi:hypothetical protein